MRWKNIKDEAEDMSDSEDSYDSSEAGLPDNLHNIKIRSSWLKKFHAGVIYIKEKITADYLTYISENKYITIEDFLKNK